jgi:hypothetical protein
MTFQPDYSILSVTLNPCIEMEPTPLGSYKSPQLSQFRQRRLSHTAETEHTALWRGMSLTATPSSHSPRSARLTIFRTGKIPASSFRFVGQGMYACARASSTTSEERGRSSGFKGGVGGGEIPNRLGKGDRIAGRGEA